MTSASRRFGLSLLTSFAAASTGLPCAFGCAAAGSGPEGALDAEATAPPQDPAEGGSPGIYDGGPPTDPYGDAGPSDPDAATSGGAGPCQAAADCPGYAKANDTVTCVAEACALSCQGESYDVNGDPSDGCEVTDSPRANHRAADAIDVGTFSCQDGSGPPPLTGMIPSDARLHDAPPVVGFDAASGSAPDYYVIHASGGVCDDDVTLALAVSGSRAPTCYALTVNTDKNGGQTCHTDATGHCGITNGTGSYSDGSDIQVIVQKTCSGSTTENAVFTVTGHL